MKSRMITFLFALASIASAQQYAVYDSNVYSPGFAASVTGGLTICATGTLPGVGATGLCECYAAGLNTSAYSPGDGTLSNPMIPGLLDPSGAFGSCSTKSAQSFCAPDTARPGSFDLSCICDTNFWTDSDQRNCFPDAECTVSGLVVELNTTNSQYSECLCAPGVSGAARVCPCAPGTLLQKDGSCIPVKAGRYSNDGLISQACTAGSYSLAGASICLPCANGGGNSTCEIDTGVDFCPPAFYFDILPPASVPLFSVINCVSECGIGRYFVNDICFACSPGTSNNVASSAQCSPCPAQQFSLAGAANCVACPAGNGYSGNCDATSGAAVCAPGFTLNVDVCEATSIATPSPSGTSSTSDATTASLTSTSDAAVIPPSASSDAVPTSIGSASSPVTTPSSTTVASRVVTTTNSAGRGTTAAGTTIKTKTVNAATIPVTIPATPVVVKTDGGQYYFFTQTLNVTHVAGDIEMLTLAAAVRYTPTSITTCNAAKCSAPANSTSMTSITSAAYPINAVSCRSATFAFISVLMLLA